MCPPVKPLTGVLFPISTLEVAPASASEICADRTMLTWSADDDVTERPLERLHTPISFQNTGRLQPPRLLICQTEINCHRRSGVTKGTHTVQFHGNKKGIRLYFLKIQTVEASSDLFQWNSPVHVGVCFYMSASVCVRVCQKRPIMRTCEPPSDTILNTVPLPPTPGSTILTCK